MDGAKAIEILLTEAGFDRFYEAVGRDPAAGRAAVLDGINPISAAVLANATVDVRIRLLARTMRELELSEDDASRMLETTAKLASPVSPDERPWNPMVFLSSVQSLADTEHFVVALRELGLSLSPDTRSAIRSNLERRFNGARDRIAKLFD
ncbi:MAG: hypothetical protein ACLFUA_11900 [Spirochaetales bacterium]